MILNILYISYPHPMEAELEGVHRLVCWNRPCIPLNIALLFETWSQPGLADNHTHPLPSRARLSQRDLRLNIIVLSFSS